MHIVHFWSSSILQKGCNSHVLPVIFVITHSFISILKIKNCLESFVLHPYSHSHFFRFWKRIRVRDNSFVQFSEVDIKPRNQKQAHATFWSYSANLTREKNASTVLAYENEIHQHRYKDGTSIEYHFNSFRLIVTYYLAVEGKLSDVSVHLQCCRPSTTQQPTRESLVLFKWVPS